MGGPLPQGTLTPRHSAYAHIHATSGHQLHHLPYTDPLEAAVETEVEVVAGSSSNRPGALPPVVLRDSCGSSVMARPRTTTEFWACSLPLRQQCPPLQKKGMLFSTL